MRFLLPDLFTTIRTNKQTNKQQSSFNTMDIIMFTDYQTDFPCYHKYIEIQWS